MDVSTIVALAGVTIAVALLLAVGSGVNLAATIRLTRRVQRLERRTRTAPDHNATEAPAGADTTGGGPRVRLGVVDHVQTRP